MREEDAQLPARVLRTGALLAAWFIGLFALGRRPDIAAGLTVGCGLSLFSFWTLAVAVPRALAQRKPRPGLLSFLLLVKLPLFGLTLYWALEQPWVNGGAVFAGATLTPTVIFLKALGRMLVYGRAVGRMPQHSAQSELVPSVHERQEGGV